MAGLIGSSFSSLNGRSTTAIPSNYPPAALPEPSRVPRPVFVIGARRSGTSLLALALGQHMNIQQVADAAWLERFMIGLQATIDEDAARGDLAQLTSLGISHANFFEAFGAAIDRLLLGSTSQIEPVPAVTQAHGTPLTWRDFGNAPDRRNAWGHIYRPTRWVDSCYTHCFIVDALHRLFPSAQFIHVARDVRETVAALIDPHNPVAYKSRHVEFTTQDAWEHWLEATTACIEAKRVLGSTTVLRVGWQELVTDPQAALQRSLDFLGEPFDPACLRPLSPSPMFSPKVHDGANLDDIPTDLRLHAETLSFALLEGEH